MLLLRPKERYPVVQAEPRAYFSAAELERATNFRSGQLWLYGARTVVELVVLVAAVRLAPRDGRRPVLTGAAAAAAITLASTVAVLPLRAASRERAKDVGLVTQSWGGWAADVAKGRRSAAPSRAPAARCWSSACAASAATGGRRERRP